MQIVFILFLVLPVLLLLPGTSPAVSMSGDSATYLQSRQAADGTKELPIYEYLNLSVQNIGKETISFQFGGWLRYDLKDNTQETGVSRSANDLSYAYLSYYSKNANTTVNLGRVMVFEGVAAERLDGIYARTDLAKNFGVSAFGGTPVETGTDSEGSNSIYGARVSHQVPGLYQIGLSYLKQERNSEEVRKEEGVDLWLRPIDKVELLGKSRYNAITSEWSDHNYVLALGPFYRVRLNTLLSSVNYKDYFTASTTAVFKFDPSVIDPNEKVQTLGEQVSYDVNDKLNISALYKSYTYDIAGNATYYTGSARYAVAKSWGAGASMGRMAGDVERLKYKEYRVYGFGKLGKTDATLDYLLVNYDEAINNVHAALSVTLAAAYELTEKFKIGADVEYSKNPDFDKDIRTFFKLIYNFDFAQGKKGGV
jgi:hypothetical protein